MIQEINQTRKDKVFSDHHIPIGRVKTYDTKFTVPSSGIVYRIYDLHNTPGSSPRLYDPYYPEHEFDYAPILNGDVNSGGRTHIIMEDWESGVASAVSGAYFAVAYEGYFYARETGTYNFRIDYRGGVEFHFDYHTGHGFVTDSERSKYDIEAYDPKFSDWSKEIGDTEPRNESSGDIPLALTAGIFYRFRIKFWNKTREENAIVASFQAPSGGDYLPLSAGNCSEHYYKADENDYFLEPVAITSVVSMSGTRQETNAAEYSFTARVSDTESVNAYNATTDSFGAIKKDMLVKFELGYSTEEYGQAAENADFITRFTGFIVSDVNIQRDKYGANVTFTCHDFKTRLISSPNLNYPNTVSYLHNQFFNNTGEGEPDGVSLVRFFDRWPLIGAVKTLLMLGGIDPQLCNQNYNLIDVDGAISETVLPRIHLQDIALDSRDNYARTAGEFLWPEDYDPLWSFRFGSDSINDIINEFAKNYGFRFSFSTDGIPTVNSVGYYSAVSLPDEYDEDNVSFDRGASNFQYYYLPQGGNAKYSFTGSRADIVLKRGPQAGNIQIYSLTVIDGQEDWGGPVKDIIMDGEKIHAEDGMYNTHLGVVRDVRDGYYPPVNSNPCVITIDKGLGYGEHGIVIISVGENGVYLDSIRGYVLDNYTPSRSYSTLNQISELSIVDNIKDMVNDVIVIGDTIGPNIGGNPNVPHVPSSHVFYRAVDVRSQVDPDYPYYRGRKIPVIIKEPKITQQERAKWLAEFTLERYRTNALLANFSGAGDPYIEVFDPITISDAKTEFITEDKVIWVTGFNESLQKGKYVMSAVQTTPRPPLPSFIKQADISELITDENRYVAFEEIWYSGSYTWSGDNVGDYGFGSGDYGEDPYGFQSDYFSGSDFENRVHFDPYSARENGDTINFSWALLQDCYQYLEIWDTQLSSPVIDPYASYGGTNTEATAADFDAALPGKLIAVLYLNTEGVADEPGAYSVSWDSVYEHIDKAGAKWANQSRYKDLDSEDPTGDIPGPNGRGVFAMPSFDKDGNEISEENWPHRYRPNLGVYPFKIRHVCKPVTGGEYFYWWGTQRVNESAPSEFVESNPYFIHALDIPDRFDIDFDFVRLKPSSADSGYDMLRDYYMDEYWSAGSLDESTYDDDDGDHVGNEYSINHLLGPGEMNWMYTNDLNYYRHSKLINMTPSEESKFGVCLTCNRPNQFLSVSSALMGYYSTLVGKVKVNKRPLDGVHTLSDQYTNIEVESVQPVVENAWLVSWELSGNFALAAQVLEDPSSVDYGTGENADTILNRFHDLKQGLSPFKSDWKRYDSTVNLTSTMGGRRNCMILDMDRDSDHYTPLFTGLQQHGHHPLDNRFLFHPAWSGATPTILNQKSSVSAPHLMGITPRYILHAKGESFIEGMLHYAKRKLAFGYVTPTSLHEWFYRLVTEDSPAPLHGNINNVDLYNGASPNSYFDLVAHFRPGEGSAIQYDAAIYTAYPNLGSTKLFQSLKLLLYFNVLDEGGRVYSIVMDDGLDLGPDGDLASLEHSYSKMQYHLPKDAGLEDLDSGADYVTDEYYDKLPSALVSMRAFPEPLGEPLNKQNSPAIAQRIKDLDGVNYYSSNCTVFSFAGANPTRYTPGWKNLVGTSYFEYSDNARSFSRSMNGVIKYEYLFGSYGQPGVHPVSSYLNRYQYNVISRGEVVGIYQNSSLPDDAVLWTGIPSSMFFTVHDTANGVNLADVNATFNEYGRV